MLTGAKRSGAGGRLLVPAGSSQGAAGAKRLPPAVLPISIGLLLLAPMFPNSLLVIAAALLLLIGSALLWRPGKSPILLFVFGYQWLQISTGIFYASWLGLSVNEFSRTPRRHANCGHSLAHRAAAAWLLHAFWRGGCSAERSGACKA